jgi:hypothetical protein
MSGDLYDKKITAKKVDIDAYDLLAKRAKLQGLKVRAQKPLFPKHLKPYLPV